MNTWKKQSRIFVAGHRGMVGSALVRRLSKEPDVELLVRTRKELDLRDPAAVRAFLLRERPDTVYLAAAKVGGILANHTYPVAFLHDNLMIECNVIAAAHEAEVASLLFLGSSCVYPKFARQPIPEEELLAGALEPTNEPYALAKIAGIKLCEAYRREYGRDYRSVMPTNLYGPHDNFDTEDSHVLPALIRRFHEAKEAGAPSVTIWGTGAPRREFLHVDDLADACVHVMNLDRERYETQTRPDRTHLNVGTGKDCTIAELAGMVASVVGYAGEIVFDPSRPDGTPRKLLEVSRMKALGWRYRIPLREGLESTYAWYLGSGSTGSG